MPRDPTIISATCGSSEAKILTRPASSSAARWKWSLTNGAYVDSLGWLYFKQGKFDEALTELLRAAELLPEPDAVVFEHIGDACDKLGRRAEAVLYWQKALQLNPAEQGRWREARQGRRKGRQTASDQAAVLAHKLQRSELTE